MLHVICFDGWSGAIHAQSCFQLAHRVFYSPDVSTRQRYSRVCNPWHTVPFIHRHASQTSAGSWIHLSFLHGAHSPEVLTGSTARRCESIAPQLKTIKNENLNNKKKKYKFYFSFFISIILLKKFINENID